MSESKAKPEQEEQMSEKVLRDIFDHWQIPCIDLNYAGSNDLNDVPYVVLGSEVYRGCEAHYFTIADAALWIPELLPSGDVVLYNPLRRGTDEEDPETLMKQRTQSWEFLSIRFEDIMERLWVKAKHYHESTDVWAHNEREPEGYLEIPENRPIPIDKILRRVDESIKDPILELNKAGFATIESCSGLKKDHEDKAPFESYVCFNDEAYHDVSAHLFTLAEIAGWDPCWGAHGFDVLLYAFEESEREKERAWKRLDTAAKQLGNELDSYRGFVEHGRGYFFQRFRMERGFFSRHYNEESRILTGFSDELAKIDAEFYSDEEED